MISSAVKRNLLSTVPEYAWIDSGHNVGFDGYTLDRYHVPGDRFVMDAGIVVEVVCTFDAFDFHTNAPVRCYTTLPVCRHCKQTYAGDSSHHYRGRFDSYCVNTPAV